MISWPRAMHHSSRSLARWHHVVCTDCTVRVDGQLVYSRSSHGQRGGYSHSKHLLMLRKSCGSAPAYSSPCSLSGAWGSQCRRRMAVCLWARRALPFALPAPRRRCRPRGAGSAVGSTMGGGRRFVAIALLRNDAGDAVLSEEKALCELRVPRRIAAVAHHYIS